MSCNAKMELLHNSVQLHSLQLEQIQCLENNKTTNVERNTVLCHAMIFVIVG